MEKIIASYGTWESPVTADLIARGSTTLNQIAVDNGDLYFSEGRPLEQSRIAVVKNDPDQKTMLPQPFNARTRVHEYGGHSFTVTNGVIYFVNYDDQNLYYIHDGQVKQVTSEGIRFADLRVTKDGIIAIAEYHYHESSEPENFLALIDPKTGSITKLASGYDFYALPCFFEDKDTTKVAWICWQHPNMPWNSTELWWGNLKNGKMQDVRQVDALAEAQSYQQPGWDKDGNLIFISDRSGWWNFYKFDIDSQKIVSLCPAEIEFGIPGWVHGPRTWGFYQDFIVTCLEQDGIGKIGLIDVAKGNLKVLPLPLTHFSEITISGIKLYAIGGSPTLALSLIEYDLVENKFTVVVESSRIEINDSYLSHGKHISFPTKSRQKIAHAFLYKPKNPNYEAPKGSKPPLIIFLHGGPTDAANNVLKPSVQFWTSRGFAVVDINYGGSTGYGRAYRQALERDDENSPGFWGDVDIKDCIACVEFLVSSGVVDKEKISIRGGSAGGFTTLAALASSPVFKAGTSYYGVSDLLTLAEDTHKFESRYLDRLLGKLPQFKNIYEERSPIHCLDTFTAPLLVLQGDEDKVVPPNQAEMMVRALRSKGVRVEYKLYKGEQHGFRKADTIVDSLNRELAFYLSVFNG